MAKRDAEDWLENWVNRFIQVPEFHQDKHAMIREAAQCRTDAKAAGIADEQLEEVTEGDLLRYLFDRQNEFDSAYYRDKMAESD
ncbi:hypothetical protein [Mesorhizobium sp.]|uniref:hypothetical protein n=1 Tax=Mesorhizobium sp. TaxID=1871066 RepID=UPI000FE6144F|nr:hypothetical protein [Mesorhizobium sp.]RWC56755.1 MAG: hypothetical protein EOS56_23330 [Mesorhizobium sp.]RWC65975.1 MAG: hypothetical protein EOS29_06920 [Mesorhizobium sp.]